MVLNEAEEPPLTLLAAQNPLLATTVHWLDRACGVALLLYPCLIAARPLLEGLVRHPSAGVTPTHELGDAPLYVDALCRKGLA